MCEIRKRKDGVFIKKQRQKRKYEGSLGVALRYGVVLPYGLCLRFGLISKYKFKRKKDENQ